MADQELGLRLKTDSDVPAAMGKAQSAVVSFDKQVQDIQKKFSTAFKDIFLGFTAPMVLLQGAIQFISTAIADAKRNAQEGLDLISKGETVFASSEEKRMALLFKAKKQREDELKLIEAGKEEMTRKFLTETEAGKAVAARVASGAVSMQMPAPSIGQMSKMKDIQGEALDRFLKSPEGAEYAKILAEEEAKSAANSQQKAGTFKSPEGFSNVVGVGSNPVMEAMAEQLEIQKQQLAALQEIAAKGKDSQTDFTKDTK